MSAFLGPIHSLMYNRIITMQQVINAIAELTEAEGWNVDVNLNGKPLKVIKKRAGSQIYAVPDGLVVFGKNDVLLSVKGSNKRGLVPRIGNIGIDVIFNGELEALKKPGNVPGALSTAGGGGGGDAKGGDAAKGAPAKPVKKGGHK